MRKLSTAAALMLAATALLTVGPFAHGGETLKIATLSPDGTVWMTRMRAAAEEIGARTQNRVTLKFYPGGIMGSDEAVLRKIRIGQLQGGAVTAGSLAQVDSNIQLYGLPLLFDSFEEVDYVRARMDELILQSVDKNGFVAFGLAEGGFAYVMSANPVRSVDDLRGQKVWVPPNDEISRVLFETAGLSPTVLPLSDVLTGLQTGLIDTVGASPVGAIALQWHTKMKYMTDAPLFYFFGTLIVDKKAFGRIAAADQAVVREVLGRATKEADRQNRLDNARAREALVQQGLEIIAVAPDKLAEWQAIARETRRRLAQKGVYSPALLSTLQLHLDTFRRAGARPARR